MELKLFHNYFVIVVYIFLLIVPYGIETNKTYIVESDTSNF